jgi:hypothetical protein
LEEYKKVVEQVTANKIKEKILLVKGLLHWDEKNVKNPIISLMFFLDNRDYLKFN